MCVCVCVSLLTLCHPMDCSPPGSSIHGILQARVLEWVAISFSRCLVNTFKEHYCTRSWMNEGNLRQSFQPPCFWVKVDILNILVRAHTQSLSCVRLFATQWTVARQAPLSMGFPKQEYWSGLSFLSMGDLPNPGTEPVSPAWAGGFFTTEVPGKPIILVDSASCSPESLHSFIMATHSGTLAWRTPWTEEPGRLQSTGSLRVEHNWATSLWLFTFMH